LDEENKIRVIIEGILIEGNLKREISSNIKRLKDIKSYRGIRHIKDCRFADRGQKQIPEQLEAMLENNGIGQEKRE